MAERRMFAKSIIDSDAFLDLPQSTQLLYFHLAMRADDDGFVNNPKRVARTVGCGDDDAKLLLAKQFIISFESGVIVIRHWRMHNYIQKDRYHETVYKDEKALIKTDENKIYLPLDAECIQDVYKTDTEVSIGEVSIGKVSIGEGENARTHENDFIIPSVEEVQAYCKERNNGIDAEYFVNYYTERKWQGVTDWKARIFSWEKNGIDDKKRNNSASPITTKNGTATLSDEEAEELFNTALKRSYGK